MSGSERACAIAFVGWGAIARRAAGLLAARGAVARLVAVAVRDPGRPRDDLPPGAALIAAPEDLPRHGLDLVVEAAGRAAVAPWGAAALGRGVDFAVASTSAFADDVVLARLMAAAEAGGARILVPPGALGGIDALAAAGRLGLAEVRHTIVKPPEAWRGTPAEASVDLGALDASITFFEGSARAAAARYPQNANAAVITALAGVGLDRTRLALVADPQATRNAHLIEARGDFGALSMRLENAPLAANPKSSEMTALALVRLIETRTGPLAI